MSTDDSLLAAQPRCGGHDPGPSARPLVPGVERFKLLKHLSPESLRVLAKDTGSIDRVSARHFADGGLANRLARALAARRAVRTKEVLEAFEFFAVVRKRLRAPVVADLCAGHGLLGVLFALFERQVERVIFIDQRPPASRAAVIAAAIEVGPWVQGKIHECDGRIERRGAELPAGCAVAAVHACGLATDKCLEIGLQCGGPMAFLPCCRPHRRSPAPAVLARELGDDTAFDVDRTYRLERAGYTVRWDAIPGVITPMNRVLLAWPRRTEGGDPAEPPVAVTARD